jgi:CHAT domain-containing protein/Tfp pilus assembly protein PilF
MSKHFIPLTSIVLALLLTLLTSHDERAARATYRAVEAQFRRDNFPFVLARASAAARAWQDRPQSDIFVSNALLQSEALLATGGAREALHLLDTLEGTSGALAIRRDIDRGNALFKVGRPSDALAALEHASHSAQAASQWQLLAEGLLLEGNVLLKTAGTDAAESAYRQALRVSEAHGDNYHRAMAIHNLGLPLLDAARYDQAATYFERALGALEQSASPRMTSVALRNLAVCYSELGDFERATKALMEAIAIQERLHANFNLTMSYGEAGILWEKQGDPRRAISYYSRAVELAAKQNATSAAARWAVNLAGTYVTLGDWANAETYVAQARGFQSPEKDVALSAEWSGAGIAAGRGRAAEAEARLQALTHNADASPTLLWNAFAQLGALRAAAHDVAGSNRYYDSAIAVITAARASLAQKQDRITYLSEPIHIYQEYVEALVAQGQVEKALLVADSSRAQVLTEGQTQAASGVRVDAIVVSYWIAPQRSYAWVVNGRETRIVALPESEPRIRELVRAYRAELEHGARDPLENPASAGWKLSDAVLKPVAPLVPAGANVIVIPDGPLHDIGLDTLPLAGHYWIEQATVSVAPSLRVLSAAAAPRHGHGGMLLVGDPVPFAQYAKLSYAAGEIDSVRRRFASLRKTVLVGADATVEGYRAAGPEQFSLIHFTAHAEANREAPLDSAVVLSPARDVYKLYARDIEPLSADLVTVSACRGAGARAFSGEGLIGFAWAFLHAGARNVVAGLWDVDDRSTARLMDRMYAELEAGASPARALHAAKLDLLRSGGNLRKPYYWGPFQAYRR